MHTQVRHLVSSLDELPEEWSVVPTFGKRPLGKEWEKNTYSPRQLQAELSRRCFKIRINDRYIVPTGIALVCGLNNSLGYLVAIDCDGETAWRKIIQINEHLEPEELNQVSPVEARDRALKYLPRTIAFTSGKKYRSQHLYLIPRTFAQQVKSRKIRTGKDENLEFRGKNLASVLPPSFHPDGRKYHWLPGCSPTEVEVHQSPDWIVAQMLPIEQEKAQKLDRPQEKYDHRCGADIYTCLHSNAENNIQTALPRTYNSVYKAIKESFDTQQPTTNSKQKEQQQQNFIRVTAELVKPPQQRNFYLFVTDTTPNPRPHARTLPERGYIYQPNTVKGNKPINIGNSYSIVSILPEKSHDNDAPWSIPLSGERVSVHHRGVDVASRQLEALMSDESLPWYNQFCVLVADTVYSQRSFLLDLDKHKNLVVIARVRSNRIFYQSPQLESLPIKKRGCPKKYGPRFDLSDPKTWSEANSTIQFHNTTRNGRPLTVTVQAWHQMLMRGSLKEKMYRHPFTLLRIHVTDDTNQSLWKPMWLIVFGQRREEISPLIAYQTYRQRYDIEHFNRFGKQRLLMSEFQTPEVKHEENWIRLVLLAYVQLFAAKDLAQHLPRPWERYLKQNHDKIVAPSVVQRDFGRIISEVGKPGRSPKPRGNSPGRVTGQTQPKRSKQSVVKKGKKTNTLKEKAA